jgi:uncharacterized protein (TIGR03790 family)
MMIVSPFKKYFSASLVFVLAICPLAPAVAATDLSRHTAKEVLLVYNKNSQISKEIADDYAKKRGVRNLVAIQCMDSAVSTKNETIPLTDFTAEIATPIRRYLAHHSGINFIVLTKGVPIRIDGGDTGSKNEGSKGNLHPSVDSYLAAIDYPTMPGTTRISITGSGGTGYAWLNRYWNATVPFSHARFGGYLVTRLDGYTQADAMSLVARAMAAEKGQSHYEDVLLDVQPEFGLSSQEGTPLRITGTIMKESDWGSWNADLVHAAALLSASSIAVDLDMSKTFIGNKSDLLGYFSWGSNDSHYTKGAYESLSFAPGSIGDTAVSTSARTFLPTSGGQSLITDLIAHGITGVKGYTDEPLLQAIASPSIALDRYFLKDFSLAESFYAASRFVGWEDIVIGDPLCTSHSSGTNQELR